MLVRTLHSATIKFPDVAANIVPVLMEFLSDDCEAAAQDVLVFVREAVQRLPHLRAVVLAQLQEVFGGIRSAQIFRAALWILGEYCDTKESIIGVMEIIKKSLGELPIVGSELRAAAGEEENEEFKEKDAMVDAKTKPRQLVTADGTYATQSALLAAVKSATDEKPTLRKFLLEGNFFIAASLATTLSKLVLKYSKLLGGKGDKVNGFAGEALFIIASIINLGKSGITKTNVTEDDLDRLGMTVKVLCDQWPGVEEIFLDKCRESLELMLEAKADTDRHEVETISKLDHLFI
uniref:Clathrin/coatomer adaptor adaptin-like N-terminal domain-containing protein n=1 Tax=Parascaris equorum TaxID=6256 RepID=A0A914RTX6_PAREQ